MRRGAIPCALANNGVPLRERSSNRCVDLHETRNPNEILNPKFQTISFNTDTGDTCDVAYDCTYLIERFLLVLPPYLILNFIFFPVVSRTIHRRVELTFSSRILLFSHHLLSALECCCYCVSLFCSSSASQSSLSGCDCQSPHN